MSPQGKPLPVPRKCSYTVLELPSFDLADLPDAFFEILIHALAGGMQIALDEDTVVRDRLDGSFNLALAILRPSIDGGAEAEEDIARH